jgi:6 kDa early secretory antigenic target
MSERIMVDHVALAEAADALTRAVVATEARLSQLDHDLIQLRAAWFGQAQEAWATAHAGWRAAEVEMHRLLADLGTRLGAAQQAYRDADLAGARAFG